METLTRLDYYEIGRAYVRSRAKRIDPAQIDIAGSDANLFVGSSSFMAYAVQRQLDERFNVLWLDGCEGEDLDRWGYDRYRLFRKGAAPARVGMEFSRPTAGGGSGTIESGRKFQTDDGIEYITTQPVIFGANDLLKQVYARAVLAGKDYQVGANRIRRPSSGQLFDKTIIINNPEAAAGGENREQDDIFRERIRGFWPAMARGTLGAIEYGARTIPGVESSSAFEVTDNGIPARLVQLFIADSSGISSRALQAAVDIELEEWRGGGIYVVTTGSIPQMLSMSLALSFQGKVDTTTIATNLINSTVDWINSFGVGYPFLRNEYGAVLTRFKSAGLIVNQGTLVSPVGDVYPERGRTLRIRASDITLVNAG